MKNLKSKFIISLILFSLTLVMTQVYAKTSIEIKPNASTIYTNQTISAFFDESIAMKNTGEVLEGSNVDVHMATNTDWAIISYFSNSAYGTNGAGENAGITTSINGKDYLSTNGNITGVMDWGKTRTYTAGVISDYTNIEDTSVTEEPYDYGKSIIENATNEKHVDLINGISKKSMALTGWYGSQSEVKSYASYPYMGRMGLFSNMAWPELSTYGLGKAKTDVTFRPMIWN